MAHTTIMRWVHQYGPELDERVQRHLKPTNDSWRVDETYIKVKGQWMDVYSAVMHMIKKKQVHQGVKSAQNEVEFIHKLFRLTT